MHASTQAHMDEQQTQRHDNSLLAFCLRAKNSTVCIVLGRK